MTESIVKVFRDQEELEINSRLPVLPLKDVVVFPYMIFPLLVGRERSLRAIQEAMLLDKMIFLTAQKDLTAEDPNRTDLYRWGVVARILQVLKLPNGLMKVLVEGLVRSRIKRFLPVTDHFAANVDVHQDDAELNPETEAVKRKAVALFKEYVQLNSNLADEVLLSLESLESAQQLAFFISAHIHREVAFKQNLLEELELDQLLMALIESLESENQILEIEKNIEDKVKGRIAKSQRTFFLQEQMRVIQEELGDEAPLDGELGVLYEKIMHAKMPPQAQDKALEELDKLRNMAPMSPESTVIRNFLDWMVNLPWHQRTKDTLQINKAKRILDEDHYGLEEPKERILEHLAVLKLVKNLKGPILCFVGPPGVGKTSLGKSVARAMGRKFVRVSLGGVRDEAEIRGHRRTYIGSMPGRILQSMKRAGTINPVFLLDEIDKMNSDFRGDPSSALLEALDPEQNAAFNDHYLEVDYDLSQVLFITTANVRAQIPEPLQDRMEIIHLPGYLEHEKQKIASGYIVPKLLREHGLDSKRVKFNRSGILKLIRDYTREAGVRNLERSIGSICRKVAKKIAANGRDTSRVAINARDVASYLGNEKFKAKKRQGKRGAGVALGLAWTPYGGDILELEVNVLEGKGDLTLTGKLGDVMKESAQAAVSYIRNRANKLDINEPFWRKKDLHLHIPEGATPKDGPSAGITIAVAMISALTGRPVEKRLAMTGEITLSGRILPIGGLNEKMLAAQRFGVRRVLIPSENDPEWQDLPPELKKNIDVTKVSHMDEVLQVAFPS